MTHGAFVEFRPAMEMSGDDQAKIVMIKQEAIVIMPFRRDGPFVDARAIICHYGKRLVEKDRDRSSLGA
jgi:hypothetical protein